MSVSYNRNPHSRTFAPLTVTDLPLSSLFLSVSDRRCGERGEKIRPLPGVTGSCTEVGRLSAAHAPPTSVATNDEGGSVRQMPFYLYFDFSEVKAIV